MKNNFSTYAAENAAQKVAVEDGSSIERHRQFALHLPDDAKSVLEVGCAEGRGGSELKSIRPGIELLGLDCVEERLDQLPECYARRILGLTNEIPLEERTIDAIVAGEFLEHLCPSDVDPTLCEFQRVLRIGGVLLMTTPNPYSLNMRRRKGTVYGVACLTQHFPEVLSWRLKLHGFSKVQIRSSGRESLKAGEKFPWLSVYGSYLISAVKV